VVANSGDDDIAVLLGTFTTTPAMVSAASYSTTAPVSPGSFVSIFATDSAITQAQSSSPPMTCLGNLGVTISDFSGAKTSLPLFYAGQSQSYAGPIQINAQIPQSVAAGAASFTVSIYTPPPTSTSTPCMSPQTGISQKGSITVAAVAPALFSANGIGKGLAAATFASVQTPAAQYVFMCPATGKCPPYVSNPIDVSEGDTFLVLYGTGIANRPGLSSVTVTVGSQALPALYAGPTPGFAGLDQVNVALPASLKGSGTVYVTVSISGTTSNQVTLDIM
jgi:uncharacterized protein (TIGR03437 family)